MQSEAKSLPDDLKACILFHGHLCPGLVYGYRVAVEACTLLGLERAADEETLAVAENDSCAVDALQVILGTTPGKGNLIIRDYGKNAFTIADRRTGRAVRFSRKGSYEYGGDRQAEFTRLEAKSAKEALTEDEKKRQRLLKSMDLLSRNFDAVFESEAVPFPDVGYAPLDRSRPCALCGVMTMETKLVRTAAGLCCAPCAKKVI